MDLLNLWKLSKFYDVPPGALLEAPTDGERLAAIQRASAIVLRLDEGALQDWLSIGERLCPAASP